MSPVTIETQREARLARAGVTAPEGTVCQACTAPATPSAPPPCRKHGRAARPRNRRISGRFVLQETKRTTAASSGPCPPPGRAVSEGPGAGGRRPPTRHRPAGSGRGRPRGVPGWAGRAAFPLSRPPSVGAFPPSQRGRLGREAARS